MRENSTVSTSRPSLQRSQTSIRKVRPVSYSVPATPSIAEKPETVISSSAKRKADSSSGFFGSLFPATKPSKPEPLYVPFLSEPSPFFPYFRTKIIGSLELNVLPASPMIFQLPKLSNLPAATACATTVLSVSSTSLSLIQRTCPQNAAPQSPFPQSMLKNSLTISLRKNGTTSTRSS